MAYVKCDYCNNYFDEGLEHCNNCGVINKNFKRIGRGVFASASRHALSDSGRCKIQQFEISCY